MKDVKQMSDAELDAELQAAPEPAETDLQASQNYIDDWKKYGDRATETGLIEAAGSATLGLSTQALVKLGLYKPEEIKKLQSFNPNAALAGEVAGIVGPAIASGGTSLAAKGASAGIGAATKAGATAEKFVAKSLQSAIKETGNKKAAQEIVKRSIEKGAGGAVEGSIYGVGQLVDENALGDADLNAENVLAYAGGGALLGGALSSTIGAVSPLVVSGANKAKGVAARAAEKIANREQDAQKLFGFTNKEILKNPNLMKDVVDYSRDRLGMKAFDSLEDIAVKNRAIKQAAIKEMDNVYSAVGDNVVDAKILNNVADKLEEQFVKNKENLGAFKSVIAPVKRNITDLRKIAEKEGFLTIKELRQVRQLQDDLAQKFYKSLDPTDAGRAAFTARSLLKDELNSSITRINPELGNKIEIANKDFSIAEKIEKALDKKLLKDDNFVSFRDLVTGGVASSVFGPEGLLLAGAQKLFDADFKRKMVILSGMKKSADTAEKKIQSSAKNFFEAAKRPVRPLSVGLLSRAYLARDEEGKQPENRVAAYQNIQKNVSEYVTNPTAYENKLVKSLAPLSVVAPQTAQVLGVKAGQIVEFLNEKLIKDVRDGVIAEPFKRPYEPSNLDLAKFERYMQVIEAPMSVLEDLEQGTLTREHVEALQRIYPQLYSKIRLAVFDQVAQQKNMAYTKKVQLGILFDMDTDASMVPQNLLALQANLQQGNQQQEQQQGAVSSTQSGVSKLDMGDRQSTDLQRVQKRS